MHRSVKLQRFKLPQEKKLKSKEIKKHTNKQTQILLCFSFALPQHIVTARN